MYPFSNPLQNITSTRKLHFLLVLLNVNVSENFHLLLLARKPTTLNHKETNYLMNLRLDKTHNKIRQTLRMEQILALVINPRQWQRQTRSIKQPKSRQQTPKQAVDRQSLGPTKNIKKIKSVVSCNHTITIADLFLQVFNLIFPCERLV